MVIDQIADSVSVERAEALLKGLGLHMPQNRSYIAGAYDNGTLIGVGSLVNDTIQGIGVLDERQNEGISASIISHLLKAGVETGLETIYLFTGPCNRQNFEHLGFRLVAEAWPYVILMEWGKKSIEYYCNHFKSLSVDRGDDNACVVVNCNPFTLGHQYLIEMAAKNTPFLYVLVVEENLSEFPFDVRLRLVKEGTAHLKNIMVLPGGKFTISSLTFPSYFTKEEDLALAHAALDLTIFAKYTAPSLKIKNRFIGTEPFSFVTAQYNQTMLKLLPEHNIKVHVIDRLLKDQEVISATKVRQYWHENNFEILKDFVPETTYRYLISEEGINLAKKTKKEV